MRIILGLLLCAAPAVAQKTARGESLRAGVDTLSVYFVQGRDTTLTGTVLDEIGFSDRQGRREIHRVYVTEDRVLGSRLDSLVDAIDLRPMAHRSRTSRNQAFAEFRNKRVAGWLRLPNGDSVSFDAITPAGVINASAFDLWLRTAPLAPGWSGEVAAFEVMSRTTMGLRTRVTGEDVVDAEPCWRVQADFGGTPVTFWIGKTSRSLRRQVMQISPDRAILFTRGKLAALKTSS
jgi:hypothetical protein